MASMQSTTVGVAQLVEPRIVIPVVVGSIPIAHPTTDIIENGKGVQGCPHPHPFSRREERSEGCRERAEALRTLKYIWAVSGVA